MLGKSPVNRIGGKFYLTNWLIQKMPKHTLYCEPFCGAGHLLFIKIPSPVEVINDIDNHLINFFAVLKDSEKRQRLVETLDYMPYSRGIWKDIRGQWKEGNLPDNEIERASWWFYMNRTCFSGDQRRGGFAVPSTTGRNPVHSFRNSIEGLDTIAERLRNVCIENLDYQDCIQRYDSENTLFYVDCPYYGSEHYYGKGCFVLKDHYRLAGLLRGIKGKAMVSHYANELYDRLYAGWNRYEYQSFKGSNKSTGEEKPVTKEVLYCNFKQTQRGLFNGYA